MLTFWARRAVDVKMTIIQKQLNEIFRESQKTQEEFGKLIGVSRQTLGTYLRGDIVPDANTIQNI